MRGPSGSDTEAGEGHMEMKAGIGDRRWGGGFHRLKTTQDCRQNSEAERGRRVNLGTVTLAM